MFVFVCTNMFAGLYSLSLHLKSTKVNSLMIDWTLRSTLERWFFVELFLLRRIFTTIIVYIYTSPVIQGHLLVIGYCIFTLMCCHSWLSQFPLGINCLINLLIISRKRPTSLQMQQQGSWWNQKCWFIRWSLLTFVFVPRPEAFHGMLGLCPGLGLLIQLSPV